MTTAQAGVPVQDGSALPVAAGQGPMVPAGVPPRGGAMAADIVPPAGSGAEGGAGLSHEAAPGLDPGQKAAVVVGLLLKAGAEAPLGELDPAAQERLVGAMARLGRVDMATARRVAAEFHAAVATSALPLGRGLKSALAVLGDHLDPALARRLAPPDAPPPAADPWTPLAEAEPADLARLLAADTPQVVAVTLSRLPPGRAAELLAALDPAQARAAALATVRGPRPCAAMVQEIGRGLSRRLAEAADGGALPGDPVERLGDILNFAPAEIRDSLLDDLETADQATAERVRRAMFTFPDIPDRIETRDVPKLARAVEQPVLVAALAAARIAAPEAADFVLANLSKRLAEQLEDEIREIGEVPAKEGEKAMAAVIQGIREMEAAGEITLILPEE